jgi:adenylate cyclase
MMRRQVDVERKLTAILCADVHGYSRLMGEDEEATVRSLSAHRAIIDGLIEQHHGRFVNSAGDSVLAEFASVVNAVECAVEIQTTLKAENASLPYERRMEFRIGVNLGDVVVEGEQIFGDGINVAARLESLADPGGICISDTVHTQIKNKLALNYQDLGAQRVKNIAEPVRVFRVLLGPEAPATSRGHKTRVIRKHWRKGTLPIAGLALIVGVIVLVQHLSMSPPPTSASLPPEHNWSPPLPSMPSIAVLPFSNLSGNPQQEYFSDGITYELISDLSRLNNLFVIAHTSSFAYKNKPAKMQEIGRELGVKYLLEGSVLRADKRVRVDTQLVEASTGATLWAERFDRPLADVLAVQDDIVQKIVTTLNLQVGLAERGVPARQRTDSLEAYDDFLRGALISFGFTRDSTEKTRQMMIKTIALDPGYADAYALLSASYYYAWICQWNPDPRALDLALEAVRKAINLDDSNPYAHAAYGCYLAYNGQHDAAIAEAQRAIALAPNYGFNYFWVADTLNTSGKPAEALEMALKAMRIDPVHRDLYLLEVGGAYLGMGRPKEAIPLLKRSLVSYPDIVGGHMLLAETYVECNLMDQAHAEAAEVMRLSPHYSLEAGAFKRGQPPSNHFISNLRKAGLK